jgi:hypothetical protein
MRYSTIEYGRAIERLNERGDHERAREMGSRLLREVVQVYAEGGDRRPDQTTLARNAIAALDGTFERLEPERDILEEEG